MFGESPCLDFPTVRSYQQPSTDANEFSRKLNWKRSLGGERASDRARRTSRSRKTNNCRVQRVVRRRLQCIISRRPSVGAIAANAGLCAPRPVLAKVRDNHSSLIDPFDDYATARCPQYYTVRLSRSRTVGQKHFIKRAK